jgi:hypothetical protein
MKGRILKKIRKVIPKKEVARRLQARPNPKTTTKKRIAKKKPTTTTPKAAKMAQGAGDKSDPKVGKFGAGQNQARGGATPAAKEAMSSTEKDKLARDKAARGSFERAKGLKKGSLAQLEDDYSKLKAGDKRAERLKGTKSKYYPVFKKRGFKAMKEGGPLKNINKKSPDYTEGLDKKFSAKVAKQNKEAIKGNQKKLDANNDGKITGADFEILRKNPDAKKKYGGKISYRMTGGQVVDSTYD